jgi:hypothetical protein
MVQKSTRPCEVLRSKLLIVKSSLRLCLPDPNAMDEKLTDSANETGLHEYVDAEFTVAGLESPSDEKGLREALDKVPGLESHSISHGRLMTHYEPVLLSQKQLEETIQRAGFQISETHATASSPVTDAFVEKNKPPKTT